MPTTTPRGPNLSDLLLKGALHPHLFLGVVPQALLPDPWDPTYLSFIPSTFWSWVPTILFTFPRPTYLRGLLLLHLSHYLAQAHPAVSMFQLSTLTPNIASIDSNISISAQYSLQYPAPISRTPWYKFSYRRRGRKIHTSCTLHDASMSLSMSVITKYTLLFPLCIVVKISAVCLHSLGPSAMRGFISETANAPCMHRCSTFPWCISPCSHRVKQQMPS